jgi:hypothetical protein
MRFMDTNLSHKAPGILKLSPGGVGWKSKTGTSATLEAQWIAKANWIRVGHSYQLEFILRNSKSTKFDGFREQVSSLAPLSSLNSLSSLSSESYFHCVCKDFTSVEC